jgi:hypothetical protein
MATDCRFLTTFCINTYIFAISSHVSEKILGHESHRSLQKAQGTQSSSTHMKSRGIPGFTTVAQLPWYPSRSALNQMYVFENVKMQEKKAVFLDLPLTRKYEGMISEQTRNHGMSFLKLSREPRYGKGEQFAFQPERFSKSKRVQCHKGIRETLV